MEIAPGVSEIWLDHFNLVKVTYLAVAAYQARELYIGALFRRYPRIAALFNPSIVAHRINPVWPGEPLHQSRAHRGRPHSAIELRSVLHPAHGYDRRHSR